MAGRGSALQRALTYFREAQIDEARVAFQLAEEIMTKRLEDHEEVGKSQARAAATPRKKRRTRAEIAAAKNQPADANTQVREGESLASA